MKAKFDCGNNDEYRDCLSCANSFSEERVDGDVLHCMIKDGAIVKETDCCEEWNN